MTPEEQKIREVAAASQWDWQPRAHPDVPNSPGVLTWQTSDGQILYLSRTEESALAMADLVARAGYVETLLDALDAQRRETARCLSGVAKIVDTLDLLQGALDAERAR